MCTQRSYHQRLNVLALAAVTAPQPQLYNDRGRELPLGLGAGRTGLPGAPAADPIIPRRASGDEGGRAGAEVSAENLDTQGAGVSCCGGSPG